MPEVRGNSPLLLGLGVAAALVGLGTVLAGRLGTVSVPLSAPPCVRQYVCQDGVDPEAMASALRLLREHGVALSEAACSAANVVVRHDPTLDDRDSADDVWPRLHERTLRTMAPLGACVDRVEVRVLHSADVTALVHGLLHATGREHPHHAPSGHVLHPERPSLRDWRGIP